MMVHAHKTRLKTEDQEASKIGDGILEMEGLSKTAGCEEGPDEITCRWIFHDG